MQMARNPSAGPFARLGFGADPWSLLEDLRRSLDQLPGTGLPGLSPAAASGVYPPVNLYETRDAWVLTAELPGVRPEDLELSVTENRVTLRGERRIEYPKEGATSLHRRERASGIFRRSVELPPGIDPGAAEAACRHGVLVLRIPKAPEAKPRHIPVNTG
jgi:HSP20 family protein